MPPPGTTKAGPPPRETGPVQNTQTQHQQATGGRPDRRGPLVGLAVRHRHSGRARYDRDVVQRCPLCAFPHWHVAFEGATSYERSPSCRPSATYLVQVVRVVPDSAPARGAA